MDYPGDVGLIYGLEVIDEETGQPIHAPEAWQVPPYSRTAILRDRGNKRPWRRVRVTLDPLNRWQVVNDSGYLRTGRPGDRLSYVLSRALDEISESVKASPPVAWFAVREDGAGAGELFKFRERWLRDLWVEGGSRRGQKRAPARQPKGVRGQPWERQPGEDVHLEDWQDWSSRDLKEATVAAWAYWRGRKRDG